MGKSVIGDYISNDSLVEYNETKYRNSVLSTNDYKDFVFVAYAEVLDGWESNPIECLKHPIMQYKNDKFVYNNEALLVAQKYGDENNKDIASKVFSIRDNNSYYFSF